MKKLTTLVCAALIIGLSAGVSATVLHVPSEYPTIQAGIGAATEGDTVLVADGTYTGDGNRDLDFGGVNMVVMSEGGPEVTIIDCEGTWLDFHRGFYFHNGEDLASVVQGFTIRNGYINLMGGGIYCLASSPTIADNTIEANIAGHGGAVYCYDSSPTIVGNRIAENTAEGVDGHGGGLVLASGSPLISDNVILRNEAVFGGGLYGLETMSTIEGNRIEENTAETAGGGMYIISSSPTIEANTIVDNTTVYGGGIMSYECTPTIEGNVITGNWASYGGGIKCSYLSGIIRNNTISGNTSAGSAGGGIRCYESSPVIEGNTITGNTANTYGGGIYCRLSYATIDGNTIADNMAGMGGGIGCEAGGSPTVINSVLWGDSASSGDEIYLSGATITVSYSDVEGGWTGEGNIDADPEFVLAEKDDYRLLWGSPCIDAGHPDSLDPDGTRSDMGAHFFDQDDYMTLYLTPDATVVFPPGPLAVTYTVINRWAQPESFWVLTEVILPNGNPRTIMGPDEYTLPAEFTVQQHVNHNIPLIAPFGPYEYRSRIGVPPSTLYDKDSFGFSVGVGD